jgi:hypothetical protein
MSSHADKSNPNEPLDLSKWRGVPNILIGVGAIGVALGWIFEPDQFQYSWLVAYMFFLSLCLGGLGWTILHHLFDASWSVPTRRICEHLAFLLPVMAILFIPIWICAPHMYGWMQRIAAGDIDHSLISKHPLLTKPGYYITSVICFLVWTFFSYKLRYWSLEQDKTGSAHCTRMMRRYSAVGVFCFAVTLTLAVIMWVKTLQDDWFSTMYAVWYFAASMWTTIFTIYTLTALLKRQGPLREVATEKTFYFIGSLMFAFTVFWGYVTFFQYFIIWNANVPEETFWYVWRTHGWWYVSSIVFIIFGHFFTPFLSLLRIDVKLKWPFMVGLGAWAWLMHFYDVTFQIMPVAHKEGHWYDLVSWVTIACMCFIGGLLAKIFLVYLNSHPIVPQKDPRIAETLDIYVAPAGAAHETGGH